MPAPQAEHLFKDLAGLAAEMSRAAAHAARGWLGASVRAAQSAGRGWPPETAGLLLLGRARMKVGMEIERRGKEIVFFFVTHDLPVTRPARAAISISVQPETEPAPGAEEDAPTVPVGETSYSLGLPWFAMRVSEIERPTPYLPPGATKEEVVLIRLDPAEKRVLAVVPEPVSRRAMRLTTNGDRADFPPKNGRFPVAPFVAVVNALRAYQAESDPHESPFALPPSPTSRNDAHVLVDLLSSACASAVSAVAGEALGASGRIEACPCGHDTDECPYTSPLPAGLADACPGYEVGDFEADMALRLSAAGQIVEAGEAGVALDLHLAVRPSGRGNAARLSALAPELLKSGPVREAILERAAESADLADALDASDHGKWDLFFEGAREGAVVFRASRDGDSDETDVLALAHQGRTVLARIEVRRKDEPELQVEIRRAEIFHDSARSADGALDEAGAGLFFSLFSQIRTWLSLL